jgi:septal ring factor EnvC (AmiA/AmiB activator)
LQGLYRLGEYGYLRLLLAIEPGADPLSAVRSLRYLARRDAQVIDRFLAAQREVTRERDRLLEEQRQVEEWAAQEDQRRRRLAQIRSRQARLLAQLEEERRQVAERAGALRDKERKLANLLDLLAGDVPEPLEGRPIQVFRGVLDWPVVGRVVEGFGTRRDERYRTEIPHNGIDVETTAGSEVRAVYPGEVLFAAPFEGYGTMVVVHHPGRVFSVYGGLRELKVEKGNVLSLGDVLGFATERIYFEIRADKRPEDPSLWLR